MLLKFAMDREFNVYMPLCEFDPSQIKLIITNFNKIDDDTIEVTIQDVHANTSATEKFTMKTFMTFCDDSYDSERHMMPNVI